MTKVCEFCGETYTRPPKRTDAHWAARRYCGHACARAARAANDGLADRLWRRGLTPASWRLSLASARSMSSSSSNGMYRKEAS